ncbi:hypothetical protein Q5H93_14760 [Hymenobacter sp. ASUV-10]|uniref:SAM domain-containing protein n=1 Tax=Hymenobacter aranciens TaxID=3063996 RepID=A0ABT9BCS2_9BACT|nr:hypothetical protein [Hymenobacter sp. ASUV-10]MDO7876002.1 hypothetical protein [Hymenobacter sp. ASUV-10]
MPATFASMEDVRDWLEGEERDYNAGVALYEVHGTSTVVRKLLALGETEFTRGKLLQALQQLVSTVPVVVPVPAPVAAPLPAPVAAVDPQRRDWFAERNYLHAQLGLVATDAERRELAFRILALGDLIAESYDQAAGRAPVPPPVGEPSPGLASIQDEGEIRRRLLNLRPQRSKLKTRPHRAADLAQVEADIYLLETKLKRDGGESQL